MLVVGDEGRKAQAPSPAVGAFVGKVQQLGGTCMETALPRYGRSKTHDYWDNNPYMSGEDYCSSSWLGIFDGPDCRLDWGGRLIAPAIILGFVLIVLGGGRSGSAWSRNVIIGASKRRSRKKENARLNQCKAGSQQ